MDLTDLSLVESAPLPSLVSTPGPQEAGPWPVLCFLHGYDEGPPTPPRRALTRHGPLRPGASPLARTSFVVVAPQLPARGDLWGRYADPVLDVVRWAQDLYHGDPARTSLTGFSFGGNGVFDLAQNQSVWAALWAVDPTRVPDDDLGCPVWLSSGEISRRRAQGFIERLGLRGPEERSGEPPAEPSERVVEDRGLDHVGTAASAYADDRVYRWLLSKQAAGWVGSP